MKTLSVKKVVTNYPTCICGHYFSEHKIRDNDTFRSDCMKKNCECIKYKELS
jgi:hypothetical protein